MPWKVDFDSWEKGILKTSCRLKISPFELQRTIELDGGEVRLSYQLRNLSAHPESFLWAFHPLLRLQPGDQLALPHSTRALLNDTAWAGAIDSAIPEKHCVKKFAASVTEGMAGIHNRVTRDRLDFIWDATENHTLGLWLTRGGWHGHHHFAIEPTNGDADALAHAAGRNKCGTVPASDSVAWQIRLRVGTA